MQAIQGYIFGDFISHVNECNNADTHKLIITVFVSMAKKRGAFMSRVCKGVPFPFNDNVINNSHSNI